MKLLNLSLLGLGAATITQNADGTGGSPPTIRHYLTHGGEETATAIGIGPHAADGIVTKDGGYVAVGVSFKNVNTEIPQGWLARVNPCPNREDYAQPLGVELTGPGNNCKTKYKWSWVQPNNNRHCHMVSVKESPDGQYLITAGIRRTTNNNNNYNGYVAKLNAETGALIWDFDYKTSAGTRSGFETVHFTEDGGFIVGGFTHREDTEFPGFKSGGQVDNGRPVFHKFSKDTADAVSMAAAPTAVWTYNCKTQSNRACKIEDGSFKNMRVYNEKGVEKVIGLPTTRTVMVVLDAATGNDLMYSGDALDSGFINDGTANDVEVEFDADGNVSAFVTTGLRFTDLQNDGGVSCANQEGGVCGVIKGSLTKYSADLTSKLWATDLNTGKWPGGDNGFAPATATYDSLVYTECWGMTKVFDGQQTHIGYATACGSGIEPGCGIHPPTIQQQCKNDPRAAWRSAVARIDLDGNLVWYALDSYTTFGTEEERKQRVPKRSGSWESHESAAEYIFFTPEGRVVAVTDEGFGGFGFLTYECEAGVTCPGDGASTTQAATTTTQAPTTTAATTTKTTQSTDGTTAVTSPTGTTPASCPAMQWKGKKATKIMYRGKTDDGKRSYVIRQTVLNNSAQQDIRTGPYTGFFMFSRRYCGTEFFDALSDGSISLGIYDYEATYTLKYKTTRIAGSKGSSVTFQYHQDYVAEEDAPWARSSGNNVKKDQFFLKIDGIPDSWDVSKEADCLNLLVGVLPGGNDHTMDFSECASTQKDAGW